MSHNLIVMVSNMVAHGNILGSMELVLCDGHFGLLNDVVWC